jgi:hypothetical protein
MFVLKLISSPAGLILMLLLGAGGVFVVAGEQAWFSPGAKVALAIVTTSLIGGVVRTAWAKRARKSGEA